MSRRRSHRSAYFPHTVRLFIIFNLVFFVVLTSVLLQGTTLPFIVKRLGLSGPPDMRPLRMASGE